MGIQGEKVSPIRAEMANDRRTEIDAVLAVRAGDRNAFGRLVALHQNRLYSLMVMMLRDRSAAEHIVQDAFVRAFTHLHQYDEHRPFYPWIAAIAVRMAQSWLRHRARRSEREDDAFDLERAPSASADPLDTLIADERGRTLWQAVASLPGAQRAAVFLYYRQDMKLKDVATALGVTGGTIKTLLFRARRRLRGLISPADEAGVESEE